MSKNGWISLHRKIQEHWLWQSDKPFDKRSAWIDILLMVNHEENKILLGNELIVVKRGEKVTSERKLAERWGWSRTKVRNFLEVLEKDLMIKTEKPDKKRTTIKVLNYNDYQDTENHKKTRREPDENHAETTEEPRENINNNDNNVNNDNKYNNSCPDSIESDVKFDKNSTPYKAACYLRKKILQNNNRARVPKETPKDMENWSIEMDRLNRLGPKGGNKGYSWKEIGKLIDWCQEETFWKTVILSASNLREHIIQIENQMKRNPQKSKAEKEDDMLSKIYLDAKQEDERRKNGKS